MDLQLRGGGHGDGGAAPVLQLEPGQRQQALPLHRAHRALCEGFFQKSCLYYIINFFQATRDEVIHLNYELWVKDNAKDMFQYMAGKVWSLPDSLSIPDERMFTFPVWSTWAQYKTHINESVIIGFAR